MRLEEGAGAEGAVGVGDDGVGDEAHFGWMVWWMVGWGEGPRVREGP